MELKKTRAKRSLQEAIVTAGGSELVSPRDIRTPGSITHFGYLC